MKRKLFINLFICALTISFSCTLKGQSTDSLPYNLAFEYYDKLDYESAIYWFTKSIVKDYKVAKSFMFRGTLESLLGNFDSALIDLKRSHQIDPANIDYYLYLARLYLFEKKYDSGLITINKAIEFDKSNAEYFDCRGTIYMNLGQFGLALKDANTGIKLDSNSDYINNRGVIKQNMNNCLAAIEDFYKALKFDSTDITVLGGIAFCRYKLKEYEKAKQICDGILNKYPNAINLLRVRGLVFAETGNKEKACKDFQALFQTHAELGKEYLDKYCK